MVLPCDLHWDVTGITKSDSPSLPAVLHDKAGVLFLDRPRRREAAGRHKAAQFTMGSLFPCFTSAGIGKTAMRIFGYCGFLIVWLLAPAPIAIADTAPVVAPDTAQSPPQPTPDELDLLNLLD
jgi:hypothetical protein